MTRGRLTRFVTRCSVAIDEVTAVQRARGDGTLSVDITPGLQVLHVEDGWALWSDHHVTTAAGLPDILRRVRLCSPVAVDLISSVYHSVAGGPPRCAGGWRTLARVEAIVRDEQIEASAGDAGAEPASLRRLTVRLADGATRVLWLRASGDGARFDVSDQRDVTRPHRALN